MEHILSYKAPPHTILRPLQLSDYDKDYFGLLSRLTQAPRITRERFEVIFNKIRANADTHIVVVVEELQTGKLLGSGTLLIEPKFIRNGALVGHIEDIVVRKESAKRGAGHSIVTSLCEIAKSKGCYKVILDCSDENVAFYQKCGLRPSGREMSLYFPSPRL
mmetsp:Transcript_7866/g.15198  ORF Transcript_7866/g.15198 Transcript_7866/m.15198 type:complete len:162 (-) Transcript_7866:4527-5012(-)